MNRTRIALLVLGALVFALLTLAACGGDDDDAGDDTDSGAEATATADSGDETEPAAEETDAPADDGDEPADDGDEPADDGEAVSDACALMSQEEVSAALGTEVQAPVITYESTANIGSTGATATVGTCNYVSPEGFDSVSITVWSSPGSSDDILTMAEQACTDKETLDVGDLACWYDSSKVEVQLASGAHFLDIFVTSQNDTAAILETLAETAVSNLP